MRTAAKRSTISTSRCPCGEKGKDGSYNHSKELSSLVIKYGSGLTVCSNHLPNYLKVGYEETMANKPKKKVVKTTKFLSLKPPLVVRDNIVSSPKNDINLRRLFAFDGLDEELRMIVKGTLGYVEFKLWMPKDSLLDDGDAIATLIGHSYRKLLGDSGKHVSCKLDKTHCYYYEDEEIGQELFRTLYSKEGSEGVWDYLTSYYRTVFTEAVTQGKIVISY